MATTLIPYYAGDVLGQFTASVLYGGYFNLFNGWDGLTIEQMFLIIAIAPVVFVAP